MIKTILLVPEDSDPHGLLKEGPCGARPPTAWRYWSIQVESGLFESQIPWCFGPVPSSGCTRQGALVLFFDGKPMPDGIDRLKRSTGGC